MFSVVETIESGDPTVTALQTLWLKNGKLYWPPEKKVDRKTFAAPQANWIKYDYKLLKTGIETFEEALELEVKYSKHRDSNSFEEARVKKKVKREHSNAHDSKQAQRRSKFHRRCGVTKNPLKSVSNNGTNNRNLIVTNATKFTQKNGKENFLKMPPSATMTSSHNKSTEDEAVVSVLPLNVPEISIADIAQETFKTNAKDHNALDPILPVANKKGSQSLNVSEPALVTAINNGFPVNVPVNLAFPQETFKTNEQAHNLFGPTLPKVNQEGSQSLIEFDPILSKSITDQYNLEILSEEDIQKIFDSLLNLQNHNSTLNDECKNRENEAPKNIVHVDQNMQTDAINGIENKSYDHLLKVILEIRDIEHKERTNMESRIHSHIDILMEKISNIPNHINDGNRIAINSVNFAEVAPKVPVPINRSISPNISNNPPEIPLKTPELCGEILKMYSAEIHQPVLPKTVDPYRTAIHCAVDLSNIVEPCPAETHRPVDLQDTVISDSESDSDDEFNVAVTATTNSEQADNDSEFESDADSIPEAVPTKSATEPVPITLIPMGEKYRDSKNFMYSRNNVGSSSCVYLRCMNNVKYNCPARAILKNSEAVLTIPHSHNAERKHVDKARFYEKLTENCKLDPFEKPLKLHLRTKKQMDELVEDPVDAGNLPNSKQTRGFIDSRIKEYMPRLPKSIEEFEEIIKQEKYRDRFSNAFGGLPFYRGVWESVKGEKSLVYISETVLNIINSVTNINLFMDGTYRALPYHMKFGQLYVINFIYKGHCYPLAYVFMQKRTFTAYDGIFSRLKLLMPSVEISGIMTDYEAAARKALRINFPEATLSGCFFHYVQAVFKYADKFKLLDDVKFKLAIQKVAALALLPNEFILIGFNNIDEPFQKKKSQRWTKFRNYWKRQWPNANISVYSLRDRTNNFSESSNKTLNYLLKYSKSNVWQLVDTLKEIEREKSDDINKAKLGQMNVVRKRQDVIRLDSKIMMATKLFEQTQDVGAFLENVTYDEDLLLFIKDHVDIKANVDEDDENIIPNTFNTESDFRQKHPREAAARPK